MAKVFDGVDYPLVDRMGTDCMSLADRDYSREAAAYQNMPQDLQGSIVPRYFGSWTFSTETVISGRHRNVRLILIEYIDGDCMLDILKRAELKTDQRGTYETPSIDNRLLPPESERIDVLAFVIEAEITLFHAGIRHRDIAPRNVMILHSPLRVVLIDFNSAIVLKHYKYGRMYLETIAGTLPISPVERYWYSDMFDDEFGQWVPESWLSDKQEPYEWLCSRWGNSPAYDRLSKGFVDNLGDQPAIRDLVSRSVGATVEGNEGSSSATASSAVEE